MRSIRVRICAEGIDPIVMPREPQDAVMACLGSLYSQGLRPRVEDEPDVRTAPLALVAAPVVPVASEPLFSTFESGGQIVDDAARSRIEGQHAALASAGVTSGETRLTSQGGQQFFASGTRMMREGYGAQAARAAEHAAKMPISEAIGALAVQVIGESRADRDVSAKDFAANLAVDKGIRVYGYALSETAIRGLMTRLESPAAAYIFGLRERMIADKRVGRVDWLRLDSAKVAEILHHECMRAPDVALKLRARENPRDVYAITSQTYSPADFPAVSGQISRDMPHGAKGTWAYDTASTAWEIRAEVWTPTPVCDQAVGEAYEGFASMRGQDNGGGSVEGGGGVSFLRCLNASTYATDDNTMRRVHRGRVLVDVRRMLRHATRAIEVLCEAWGTARAAEMGLPIVAIKGVEKRLTIEDAIPGFYRALLTDKRQLANFRLPGRTEEHVKRLALAYQDERRDVSKLVRADIAQGWTRYIQDQPAPIRREAESAIGSWLVSGRELRYEAPARAV